MALEVKKQLYINQRIGMDIKNKLDEAREVTLGEGGAEVEVEEEVLTKREKILLARKKQLQRRRVGNRPIPPVLK